LALLNLYILSNTAYQIPIRWRLIIGIKVWKSKFKSSFISQNCFLKIQIYVIIRLFVFLVCFDKNGRWFCSHGYLSKLQKITTLIQNYSPALCRRMSTFKRAIQTPHYNVFNLVKTIKSIQSFLDVKQTYRFTERKKNLNDSILQITFNTTCFLFLTYIA
jgi:hypothetical protein